MSKPTPGADFDPAYLVTLDEIYHCHWTARKRRRIAKLRRAVEHFWPGPVPARLVHISGTNGKGSVAHYLDQGFRFAGATGSWTGPHLFDYAERIHISGASASHAEITDVYRRRIVPYIDQLGEDTLGFPEIGILLSLHLFVRHDVAWGLMESGVGGRYTPLMALPVSACVVTNVGDDHPITLGTELWQRALEKAGNARPGVPFFTAARGEALPYVVAAAESEGAQVRVVGEDDCAAVHEQLGDRAESLPQAEVSNLALAVTLVRHFYPEQPARDVLEAMVSRLPGRFWSPRENVIVDVAHNREKLECFAERLKLTYPGQRFRFLIGLTRKRDPREIFAPLFEIAEEIIVTSASYPGREPEEIAARLREDFTEVSVRPEARQAYEEECKRLGDGDMLVLTGSAYMIDQALNSNPYVRHLNASFGWRGRIGERV